MPAIFFSSPNIFLHASLSCWKSALSGPLWVIHEHMSMLEQVTNAGQGVLVLMVILLRALYSPCMRRLSSFFLTERPDPHQVMSQAL